FDSKICQVYLKFSKALSGFFVPPRDDKFAVSNLRTIGPRRSMKNIVRTTLLSVVGLLALALAISSLPQPVSIHGLWSAIGSCVRKVYPFGRRPTSAPGVTYERT